MLSPGDTAAERPLTHRERRTIVFGTLLPVFLGSLDQTILASALPTIGRDIGHVSDLPWLITAYLLAATAMTPLFGKISDIRGRRSALCIALALYLAGSLICALAPNFLLLVAGRVVQGVGGGGLTALSMVVLGDVASPKERGKYYGWFSATYTAAGALGPLLGGLIAEHLHWSMLFWMNLPLGLIAFAVVSSTLRRLPRHERPHQLDLVGAGLIVAASVSFMLMLNIGGIRQPWTSAPVLMLLALAVLTGVCFVLRLLSAPEPLIPLSILRSAEARCAIAVNAFGWGALIGLNIYLPAYLQTVLGFSATHAGLSLMILMVAVNTSAGVGGNIIGRVTHYKRLPILGLVITVAAVCVLAWQAEHMTFWTFQLILAVIGIGFGPVAPLSTVVLQNSVQRHQFGTAVGTMNFSRSLYATILVAIFGVIVLAGVQSIAPGQTATTISAEGFSRIFLAVAVSMTIALGSLMLLKEKPLQTRD
jgi:EmrB/QacA subfamily drug resistance transporter